MSLQAHQEDNNSTKIERWKKRGRDGSYIYSRLWTPMVLLGLA